MADDQASHEEPVSEADTPSEGDTTDPSSTDSSPERTIISADNMAIPGYVTLHYPERDVRVLLDGDAAVRLLRMFRQRYEAGLSDVLDAESSALAGWLVLDLAEPLAMSWLPVLRAPRTAIDPAVA